MFHRLCLLAAIFAAFPAGAQEIAYVTDILRLGIHEARDTSDQAFAQLVSGTELTVLERTTNYTRVRTPDGREGWVRSAFIVTEKPAQARIAELTAELDSMRERVADAEAAQRAVETNTRSLTEELTEKVAAADAVQDTLGRLRQENEQYAELFARYRGAVPLVWVAGAILIALLGGALGGTWMLDRSIRRRFGGHRIY